jgi:hypothetical protein
MSSMFRAHVIVAPFAILVGPFAIDYVNRPTILPES